MNEQKYIVVRNDEEQFSLWAADAALPLGWHAVGAPGTKEECLGYIAQNWSDIRPKSAREGVRS